MRQLAAAARIAASRGARYWYAYGFSSRRAPR
jgi:hypothetical protein